MPIYSTLWMPLAGFDPENTINFEGSYRILIVDELVANLANLAKNRHAGSSDFYFFIDFSSDQFTKKTLAVQCNW